MVLQAHQSQQCGGKETLRGKVLYVALTPRELERFVQLVSVVCYGTKSTDREPGTAVEVLDRPRRTEKSCSLPQKLAENMSRGLKVRPRVWTRGTECVYTALQGSFAA